MNLLLDPSTFAICRFDPKASPPEWAFRGPFYSISKTSDELSVVCQEDLVPEGTQAERGWRCFKVQGPLDFGLTGILASLANPLAQAGVSIFAVSTFDTDYLLVKAASLEHAKQALLAAGHAIQAG